MEVHRKFLNVFIYLLCLITLSACSGGGGSSPDNSSSQGPTTTSYTPSDMNGDGIADLILQYNPDASSSSYDVGFKATNSGAFDSSFFSKSYSTVWGRAKAVAVADANNDGMDDILVQIDRVEGTVHLEILLSREYPPYEEIQLLDPVNGADVGLIGDDFRAVGFNDMNGDGYADVLVRKQINGVVSFYISRANQPGGSYSPFELIADFDLDFGMPEIVAMEDINDDGNADIVITKQSGIEQCFFPFLSQGNTYSQEDASCIYLPTDATARSIDIANTITFDANNDYAELIVTYDRPLATGETRTVWITVTLVQSAGGPFYWGVPPLLDDTYESTHSFGSGNNRLVAARDLNNDGRDDMLVEKTIGSSREWWAYLSTENMDQPQVQLWLTGLATDNTLGLRDFNGDGFPDLLIDATNTTVTPITQRVTTIYNDNGAQFSSLSMATWYEDTRTPKIVGLSDDGLTTIANDRTGLLAWAGVANKLYTQNEFEALLQTKGLSMAPADDLVAGNALALNQCTINYSQTDTSVSNYNVSAKAEFGMLVCNVQLGDRASLRVQMIYGGCDVTDGLYGAGGKCEIGTFKTELEVDLFPAPTTTLAVSGPNAEVCGGVSASYLCANVGAELASTSGSVEAIGIGGGAKLAVGVSAGADFAIENGVISGSIDLAFIVGGSIEFSLDPAETGEAFYKLGEASYLFAEDAGEMLIYTAGPVVYDAASAVNSGVNDVVNVTASGAVYVASEAGNTAIVIFEDAGQAIGTLFTDLSSAAADVVNGVVDFGSGVVGDIGDFFGGLF